MVSTPGAKRAAFATAPHLVDPSGAVAIWLTDPPGAVMQFTREAEGTVPLAKWIVGPALEHLLRRFTAPMKLVIVMDLGLMTGRDAAVRPILTETAKNLRPRIERSLIVPPVKTSAIYLASLHAAVSLLRVFGVPVETQTLPSALANLRAAEG